MPPLLINTRITHSNAYCTLQIACAKLLFLFGLSKLFHKKYAFYEKRYAKIWIFKEKAVPLHPQTRESPLKEPLESAILQHRGVEQLVARQAHNLEVARSNPASATKRSSDRWSGLFSFCRYFQLTLILWRK